MIEQAINGSTSVLLQLGIAGVAIIGLSVAVIQLYKKLQEVQEKRLAEAKEVRDNLSEPLKAIGAQQEKIYDILLSDKRGR